MEIEAFQAIVWIIAGAAAGWSLRAILYPGKDAE